MQDGVTKYNKTWNMVYVALTRAKSELVVAVDMSLLGKEYKHNDIVESLETIGFEALNQNFTNYSNEEKLDEK
jgi:ATP-dependent exoDNAse (exonuclease V) beta subunit